MDGESTKLQKRCVKHIAERLRRNSSSDNPFDAIAEVSCVLGEDEDELEIVDLDEECSQHDLLFHEKFIRKHPRLLGRIFEAMAKDE